MDKLQKSDLEQILGIYSPYSIRSMEMNPVDETLLITLEENAKKARFSLMGNNTSKRESLNKNRKYCEWQHLRLGRFDTIIKAAVNPENNYSKRFSFLGSTTKDYSYGLQNAVEQARAKGLDVDTISMVMGIEQSLASSIITDIEASENERQANAYLPLDSDPIWRAVLTHELNLTTKLLPLKLLLSRLKLNVYNQKGTDVMQSAVAELRQFFAQHSAQLKSEYAQLGIQTQAEKPKESSKGKLRLKLPGLSNPIWHQILSGNFDLHSRDMPLNLFITKLKKQYAEDEDPTAQKRLIADLQMFFKKNARSLIPELKILTKIITGESESEQSLSVPDENHVVWQRILENQANLPTDKMNYLLLLSKLRSTLLNNQNVDARQEAIRQLREFFVKNQSVFSQEIKQLNELSVAI